MKYEIDALYRVEWIDAYADNTWADGNEPPEDALVVTVGFFVAASDKTILLAATRARADDQSNARFAIPKCCILKAKRIGRL